MIYYLVVFPIQNIILFRAKKYLKIETFHLSSFQYLLKSSRQLIEYSKRACIFCFLFNPINSSFYSKINFCLSLRLPLVYSIPLGIERDIKYFFLTDNNAQEQWMSIKIQRVSFGIKGLIVYFSIIGIRLFRKERGDREVTEFEINCYN